MPFPALEKRPAPLNFLTLIATVIFVAGLLAAGGVFVYKLYLGKMNDSLAAQLVQLKPDESAINSLKQFNQRVVLAKRLLVGHTTLVPLFSLLEQLTLQDVRFTSFSYAWNSETHAVTLTLGGQAKSYEAIALQSDSFNGSGVIKNAIFSGLTYDADTKYINFRVNATVDASYLSYSTYLTQTASAASPSQPTMATTTDSIPPAGSTQPNSTATSS